MKKKRKKLQKLKNVENQTILRIRVESLRFMTGFYTPVCWIRVNVREIMVNFEKHEILKIKKKLKIKRKLQIFFSATP